MNERTNEQTNERRRWGSTEMRRLATSIDNQNFFDVRPIENRFEMMAGRNRWNHWAKQWKLVARVVSP